MFRYCKATSLALCLLPLAARAQPSFIVRLADGAPAALVSTLEARVGGAAKQERYASLFEHVSAVRAVAHAAGAGKQAGVPFAAYTLQVTDSTALAAMRARWAAHEGVAYVQDNHRYRLDAPDARTDDPRLDSLAHLPVIRAFDAWRITTGSPAVRIGLVDTGLFLEHPDLKDQVWVHAGEDLNGNGRADADDFNGVDDDGNGYVDDVRGFDFVDRGASVEQGDYLGRDPDPSDDDREGSGRGHGTLVAGVMAAALGNGEGIAGVAPGCRLVPLRAFGADGLGEDDDVAAAIVYAAQMGIDVLNLSFGDVYYSPIMREAIQFAVARGTVVVASAGNLGGDGAHYPSDYPEVLSVAWLNEDGTGLAGRGQFGPGIDLGAPGSFVYTTLFPRFDEDGAAETTQLYGRRSGSSVAAPMVSGAAALLRSVDPSLSPATIHGVLTGTARDLADPGWDHRTAAGLLDVGAALLRSLPARVEIDAPDHDAGFAGEALAITGTVADPNFASYALYYAAGDEDPDDGWQRIAGPSSAQRLKDTLAVWRVGTLPEGVYTLRLAASLRTGRTIEDRRRLYLDRTPPQVTLHLFNTGLVGGAHGVVADVATDDLTDVEMRVTIQGGAWTAPSDRRARRHALAWADEQGRGGDAAVAIVATNRAGLQTTLSAAFAVPPRRVNTALFDASIVSVPHGYLLPRATDFDRDRLLEITLNRYQDGWIGDTLATYEWDGTGFRPASKLLANVIPRDVGDTNANGLLELLNQVAGATLVLEQTPGAPYPVATSFIDTTGLGNPFDPQSTFGARLTDLDGDGHGEILAHNTRQWRVLEWDGGAYREVTRLDNPTTTARSEITENEFQQPLVLIDDFDGDGRTDLLTGDGDGDWILYEATGDDALAVSWTYETNRYNAGAQFAGGDFDGDGLPEFVTFTQNWTQPTSQGAREPDIGLYYFWDAAGDDAYVLVDSLPVHGNLSRHNAMTTADFDGDGRDELVLVHAPDLYVFSFEAGMHPVLRFHRGKTDPQAASGLRSIALVADDFDGDGTPELIAAGADERLRRFVFNGRAVALPPPVWERAVARDAAHAALAWQAPGADSVTVYRGLPGEALDPVATTPAGAVVDAVDGVVRYALRAWYAHEGSPLSEERVVVPRSPARVVSVAYPGPDAVEVVFSEPLDPSVRAAQFALDAGGPPAALSLGRANHAVLLRFERLPARVDTLRWMGVRDVDGRPLGQDALAVAFPDAPDETLIVTAWEVLGAYEISLTFSAALDPASARDVANYRLQPTGMVVAATWGPEAPAQVTLAVEGRPIGATGLETSLVVERLRGAAGERLAREGNTIALSEAAADLSGVYLFPNPHRADRHQGRVMVAGLPPEAVVEIFSLQGEPVRRIVEPSGNGGVAWDLTDEKGRPVPSGIYLVRVEAPGERAVLRKAAVIR